MVRPREKKEKTSWWRSLLKDWRKKFLAIFLVLLMVFSALVVLFNH
jgi:hypothetical protein